MTRTATETSRPGHAPRAWLVCCLLALTFAAQADEQYVMRFDRISVSDGLAQSSVMAMAQDQTGYIWFATENGIDRFDGVNFTNYRHERGAQDTLGSDFTRDLHVSVDGSLWIATDDGGLSRWDPSTNRFQSYRHDPGNPNSIASDRLRAVTSDASGTIWIGTQEAGLDRLNPVTGEITHFRHNADDETTLSNDDIYAIEIGLDGTIWIGTRNGLNALDPETGIATRHVGYPKTPGALTDNHVRSLLIDHEGHLWIGTHSARLARVNTITLDYAHYVHDPEEQHSIVSNRVEAVYQDQNGRIWAGTDKGLSLWLEGSERFLTFRNDPTDPTSLSGNSIFSIFQDRGGVFWVGTRTGGVSKWNPRSWSFGHFRPDTSEGSDFRSVTVTSFAEDREGHTWIGTFGGGINVLDDSKDSIRVFRRDSANPLSDDRVMALAADRRGQIWAGTMTGGLNQIDIATGNVTVHTHDADDPGSISANGIMSLHVDRQGMLWVGTFGGGVSRHDPIDRSFTNFRHDPLDSGSISSPRATSLAGTSDGVIWVGTEGGGLNRFDRETGEWRAYRHDPNDRASLSADTVYSLHVDARDRLWVGTRSGLDLLVRAGSGSGDYEIQEISADIGLTRSAIYGIESDSRGTLWLSTSHGLVSYRPGNGTVRKFHKEHGLQDEEFNFGASFQDRDGRMYFGGPNGFNAFRPEALEFNRTPPPVVLTSVSVMNEPILADQPYELLKRMDLGYDDDVVTFEVAALDYAAPENNHYAYRLVGFDEEWTNLGNKRRITYTNLNGGNYELQVKAANSDGVWNQAGVNIPIGVANPPWKTWWAYSLYLLATGLSILAFWQHQQNKLRREYEYSRRLEREVHQRTKQLNARNKDLKEVNAKLIEASTTDSLTGLRNRRFLFEQIRKDVDLVLRHYRDGSETLAPGGNNDLLFLMVDLDNFKPVNDTCGHEAGDELLLQIRDVLLDACRSSDDVIRWGGDEFLIVARETNRKYAAVLADRIRTGLSQRVFPLGRGQVARITSSIGYASYPFIKEQPELLTWEEVLGVADAAMYEAKQKRNAWTGIEGLDWTGSSDELCRAIKENPGQLAEDGFIRALESVEDVEQQHA